MILYHMKGCWLTLLGLQRVAISTFAAEEAAAAAVAAAARGDGDGDGDGDWLCM